MHIRNLKGFAPFSDRRKMSYLRQRRSEEDLSRVRCTLSAPRHGGLVTFFLCPGEGRTQKLRKPVVQECLWIKPGRDAGRGANKKLRSDRERERESSAGWTPYMEPLWPRLDVGLRDHGGWSDLARSRSFIRPVGEERGAIRDSPVEGGVKVEGEVSAMQIFLVLGRQEIAVENGRASRLVRYG